MYIFRSVIAVVLNFCREKNRNARQSEDSRRVISIRLLKNIKILNISSLYKDGEFI